MGAHLALLDWLVIALYLAGLVFLAIYLTRRQHNREDYYVGGRGFGPWPVAISIMATQCSTNSILGAPAFVAFAAGGGLVWLQYELALPLAMAALILWVMPTFRRLRLVSVYEFLEGRFDLKTRLVLSALFQFVRAFATAVTVYSIAIVIDLITGVGFFWSVLLLGGFTVVYDVLGGMRGVIISDVLQMAVLVFILVLLLVLLIDQAGGVGAMLASVPAERIQTLDFRHHGLGDGHTFAFWPMLLGGFFLYAAYYGCDQSQVQRELSTVSVDATNQSLWLNGLLRFPVVALYCFVGVGIAVYAQAHPSFIDALPRTGSAPEYNLAVPLYMISQLPAGVVGLGLVALFAAAMSSLDSVINSLSATTMEDFVRRFRRRQLSPTAEIWLARWITTAWGIITLAMSFFVDDIAPTVLEAINKIGSLANGPILAVFALGLLTRKVGGTAAVFGLAAGVVFNGYCWIALPEVSWLWWNVLGFVVTTVVAAIASLAGTAMERDVDDYLARLPFDFASAQVNWPLRCVWLVLWFGVLLAVLMQLGS